MLTLMGLFMLEIQAAKLLSCQKVQSDLHMTYEV